MSEKKVEPAFVPASDLERLLYSGDPEGVIQYFHGLQPSEFSKHRKEWQRVGKLLDQARFSANPAATAWRGRPTDLQLRAFYIAGFICGSTDDKLDCCFGFYHQESNFLALWRQFPPSNPQEFAETMLIKNAAHFGRVQELFLAGIITRPLHDNYALGLLALPMESDRVLSVRKSLERDPGLVSQTLLRLFEIEGSTSLSLSGQDKYGHGITSPRNTWSGLFLELCASGVFSRDLLLSKTLGTLEKDWIQFRSGWFSRFHELLAPTVAEMAPHAQVYLGLCNSRIAPTVTLALEALEQLLKGGMVDGAELLAALRPVLSSSVKSQVESALKLLDQLVAKDASLAAQASEAAIPAFAHAAADVHKKLIKRLQAWGLDAQTKDAALAMLPLVSAANHDALAALLDVAPKASATSPDPSAPSHALQSSRPPLSALDASRAIVPIIEIDELVDRTTYVLENTTDTEELERVLEALLRLAPFSADDRQRLGPVLKRARKLKPMGGGWRDLEKPVARELSRLLVFLLAGEKVTAPAAYAKGHSNAHGWLCERIEDLMDLASQGQSVSPLAAPTHRCGFIAPGLLIERAKRHWDLGVTSPLHEQVLSLLRLAPTTNTDVLAQAETLPQTPYGRALRYALGATVEVGEPKPLFVAAGRIRHPNADDANLIEAFGELGPDGPHAARYAFSFTTSKGADYTFHYGEVATQPQPRSVAPDYLAIMRHSVPVVHDWGGTSSNPFGTEDESLIRLTATLMPSCLEAFFAEGVRRMSNNLDWSGAEWHNKAYLALLLDPTVPYTPMAYLVLACGLYGKEAGQAALAVDALVAGWLKGRLEAHQMGATLRDLARNPLVKLARLGKSLTTASGAHEQTPRLVFELLCSVLQLDAGAPPKDTAVLLELLLEVGLGLGASLPHAARASIENMAMSGKGKTAQKDALERLA